jgi:hypothetical protein
MNVDEKPCLPLPTPPANEDGLPLHERIFYAGVLILVAGLTGAALIFWFTADSALKKTEIEFANPRAYEFQIERLGGKATVYVVRFNEWFTGLWQGRPLAYTVAVLTLVIALICFWLSKRMAEALPPDRDQGGEE